MKLKNRMKIIAILIILFIISLNTNIYATEIEKGEYSKRYEEWLKLDEEERKNTIAPLPINIRAEKSSKISSLFRLLRNNTIPSKYDLREHINLEVKNQMQTNTCWAFSANTMLETYLELNNKTYNFSERHLEYNTAKNFLDGNNPDALNREIGVGGYSTTAFTYYSRGSGPILEEDMPFENNENEIKISELPTSEPVQKVDNMIYFPSIYKRKDKYGNIIYEDASRVEYTEDEVNTMRNRIKEHIINYGAISVSVNADTTYLNTNTGAANLNIDEVYANHSVTIIGWDDNYSKDKFPTNYQPTTNGAYIVLNSWGKDWGTTYGGTWKGNGIYYVSYEDFLIETDMRGVTSVSNIEYDYLHQHDTSEMYSHLKVEYAANVFSAEENERLTEVMIGTWNNQTCNIYINKTGDLNINNLTKVASNVTLKPGYNTIKINDDIIIPKGNKFSVVVEFDGEMPCIGIEDNCGYFSNAVSNKNESYVSNNGAYWKDLYDLYDNTNLSIKAYTKKENIDLPKQVTGVKLSSIGYDHIVLSWQSQNNITGYEIYDCNTLKSYFTTSNIYKISNLKEGTTYRFKVRAYKTIGGKNYYGDFSSLLYVTTNTRIDISKCWVLGVKNKTYTGSRINQNITIQYGSKTLKNGADYVVNYSNNKDTGKATIVITGEGDYKGTITKTFLINPSQVKNVKAKEQSKSTITIKWDKNGGKVTGYKIYSYNYKKEKWEYVGKTSNTSYKVKKLKEGTTYKYRVRAYKSVGGSQYFGLYSSSIKTGTKTKTPSISKLTTKSKKATIKWKKISGASGYQIYMATSKKGNYSKIKTITKGKTTTYTKTKLKRNKRYYFKIRTYKTVDGKKIYSSYSSIKSIKIK